MQKENIHKDEVLTNIINEYNPARDYIKRQNLIKIVKLYETDTLSLNLR